MKRFHPKLLTVISLATILIVSVSGCANRQNMASTNPFIGQNRVPPPGTRSLAPGQAQPYYPGDPLSAMQNNAGQPLSAPFQTPAEPEMPSATPLLTWGNSGTNADTGSVVQAAATPQAALPVVASNEPQVAIPDDGSDLRFPLSTMPSAEPQPFAPTTAAQISPQQPATPQSQPLQLGSPPSTQGIVQATYTEPIVTHADQPSPSPWQTPQIGQTTNATTIGQPLAINTPPSLPAYVTPTPAYSTMQVQMREVPSPPMPRIRIPGSDSPEIASTADGFRPRTSMR